MTITHTDPITQEDEFISYITDPQLQTELRWQKYVKYLKQGAWGDNIAMHAVSDMLSLTIYVLSSHYPMYSVISQICCATNEVFVGLILYVGLDKLPAPALPIADKPAQPNQSEPAYDDEPDEATTAEGEGKSVGPHKLAWCVLKILKALAKQCVLPQVKERETTKHSNPVQYGTGTFSCDGPRKLTYRKYFNQRLMDVDGRFSRDLDYLFVAQYIVEFKQVRDDGNNWDKSLLDSSQLPKPQIEQC